MVRLKGGLVDCMGRVGQFQKPNYFGQGRYCYCWDREGIANIVRCFFWQSVASETKVFINHLLTDHVIVPSHDIDAS